MNWFSAIVDFLTRFWPFEIVYAYQNGIRFWLGKDGKVVGPGLYAFIPYFGHVEVLNIALDVLKLFDQSATTKDGISVMMAANVSYRIVDVKMAYLNVQHLENNLGDAFRRHLLKRVRDKTWDELVNGQPDLERSCKGTMTTFVRDWGVEVVDVGFVSFAKTRSISLTNL